MPFDSLGLAPALVQAAARSGFSTPTPIQAAAIPAILQGRDLRGSAQTGSGKTAAFSLPLLQRLTEQREGPRRVRALVLVPTRELAGQVGDTMHDLAQHLPERLKIVTAFGGVSINPQMMSLRGGADIVVATPGRLLDLVEHNALRLDAVAMLVLDEADRLFDLGFAEELGASSNCCRSGARTCSSPPPSRRPSRRWPTACCATPPSSTCRASRAPRPTSCSA